MDIVEIASWLLFGVAILKSTSALLMMIFTKNKDIRDWLVILSLGAVAAVGYAATYRHFFNPGFNGVGVYFWALLLLFIVSGGVTFFVAANIWNHRHDH